MQVHIPQPCTQPWADMTPNDKGRFCLQCSKTVIDFTAMTDVEVLHHFQKPAEGGICGRFRQTQLQTSFVIPAKSSRFLRIPAAIASILLGLFSLQKVHAQSPKPSPIDTVQVSPKPVCAKPNQQKGRQIQGRITDGNDKPISGAIVRVEGSNLTTITDEKGAFLLAGVSGKVMLVFSAVGYESRSVPCRKNQINLDTVLLSEMRMGEVVIVAGGAILIDD